MSHQVIIPSSGTGGDGRMSSPSMASVVIAWVPSHDITPAQERRRIDRADRMRQDIIEMLEAPGDGVP